MLPPPSMPAPDPSHYDAKFFGSFRISFDGHPLGEPTWRRNRAKALLKWFLLNPAEPFSADQLCTLFWPDRSQASAANNLNVTLHYLRHVLEPALPPRQPSTFIRRNFHKFYWFDFHDVWSTDVQRGQELMAAAGQAEHLCDTGRAIELYTELVELYRMTFLPEDLYEDVFAEHRRAHDLAHGRSLSRLMQLYLGTDDLPNALTWALHGLSVDPYSEEAVTTIVQIYVRQGNVTGAIRQLDQFLHALDRDLGMPPPRELLKLRNSILRAH